ncbi:hypothetical protein ABQ333_17520 [Serratia fonticola]|uniref:hypothetical protein n=1 Tax=Serratia fonticola TaxID=47917 RepID=UPI003AAFE305
MQVVQVSGVTAGNSLTTGDIEGQQMDRGYIQAAREFGVILWGKLYALWILFDWQKTSSRPSGENLMFIDTSKTLCIPF